MTETKASDNLTLIVGVLGVGLILLVAIGYALWASGNYFDPESINQFVTEQSSSNN